MRRLFVTLSLLTALPGMAWNLSTTQTTPETKLQAQRQAPEVKSAEGELARVDSRNKLLWIKTPDGKEMQFSYTDQTKVQGSGGTVEGLANMGKSQLRIQYQSEGATNVAIQIQVQSGQG